MDETPIDRFRIARIAVRREVARPERISPVCPTPDGPGRPFPATGGHGIRMETGKGHVASVPIGPEDGRPGSAPGPWLRPITRLQRAGLLAFLAVSAVDIVLSAFLFFGAGGFVEANPLLAWATEGLLLFLVAVLGVKAIGAGLIAVLVSIANRFCTLAGDAVLFAALCTTTSLFVLELFTVGPVPALLA